jgi:hypothetical protein
MAGIVSSLGTRVSTAILISEVAVATVVTVGALFVGGGIWSFLHQPLGFDYADRWGVSITTASADRPTAADFEAVADVVRGVSGVRAAGPRYTTRADAVEVPSRALAPTQIAAVGLPRGYAETWNLRLRAGSWFTAADYTTETPLAIVDEKFARLAWPEGDAIGREIRVGGTSRIVIGVIAPKRESLLIDGRALAYVPSRLPPAGLWLVAWAPDTTAADLQARIRSAVGTLQPAADVRVDAIGFDDLYLREVGEARFQAPIVAAFGALTFALVAVGVFGLVSYLVAQRTREFGVRLALGARRWDIGAGVMRRVVVPGGIGIALGVVGAYLLESIVRASLFGWAASSGRASIWAGFALIAVVIGAALLPAWRAMSIDPSRALRAE